MLSLEGVVVLAGREEKIWSKMRGILMGIALLAPGAHVIVRGEVAKTALLSRAV